jgi:predicted RNA-binding protein with PUA-like domain
MSVWIFQDQRHSDMAARLQARNKVWTWNVDRYILDATDPHIQSGDIVLQWQPYLNNNAPAGIYACARVIQGPYQSPNEKSNWQVDVQIIKILERPITLDEIKATQNPLLLSMLIIQMPGGHIVFPIISEAWVALQQLHGAALANIGSGGYESI